MLLLSRTDPGIIPKIFGPYENPAYRKIPISS